MSHSIVRKHEIHCGHRVVGHESKCQNLHGHSYVFEFYCTATKLDKMGRVIDFSVIKTELCEWLERNWDHRMLLWEIDPLAEIISNLDLTVVTLPFNPTAENLASYLTNVVAPDLLQKHKVTCYKTVVHETSKCRAIYEI